MQANQQKLLHLDGQGSSSRSLAEAVLLGSHEVDSLRKASAGDQAAIGSLVDRWADYLYHFTDALRISAGDADAIVEEVLRRLIFEGARMANVPDNIGPWLLDTFKACAGAVVSRPHAANRADQPQSNVAKDFSALLISSGLNDALRYLNSLTPFRFTGVYRVDGLLITNLVLYDRQRGFGGDGLASRISDTFCVWVHETLSVVQLTDSLTDPRAIGHPKRNTVRSYCGGPVRNSDGLLIGTLCHFDYEPHSGAMPALDILAEVGPLLAPVISSVSSASSAQG